MQEGDMCKIFNNKITLPIGSKICPFTVVQIWYMCDERIPSDNRKTHIPYNELVQEWYMCRVTYPAFASQIVVFLEYADNIPSLQP